MVNRMSMSLATCRRPHLSEIKPVQDCCIICHHCYSCYCDCCLDNRSNVYAKNIDTIFRSTETKVKPLFVCKWRTRTNRISSIWATIALLGFTCLISGLHTNHQREVKPRSLIWTQEGQLIPPKPVETTLAPIISTSTASIITTTTTTTTTSPVEQPDFEEPIGNHTVALGRDVQLSCKIRRLGNFRTAWLRVEDKGILTIHNNLITRNYRIGLIHNENDDESNFMLTIRNVLPSDKGGYMCQINSVPMRFNVGYLDVLTPPIFDENTPDTPPATDHDGHPVPSSPGAVTIVSEGQTANLSCRASGHPNPTISWRREDNDPILVNGGQVENSANRIEGPTLRLNQVSRLNSGAYLCIASNGVQPAASRRQLLDVQFAPIVAIPQTEINAQLGQRQVQLVCLVELNPVGSYHWFKLAQDRQQPLQSGHQIDGLELVDSDKHEFVMKPVNSEKVQMILNIRQVGRRDFGMYKCAATNSLGSQSNTIHLTQSTSSSSSTSGADRELNDQQDQAATSASPSSRAHSSISWLTTTLASTGLGRLKQDSPTQNSKSPLKQFASSMSSSAVSSIHGSRTSEPLQALLLFFLTHLMSILLLCNLQR